MKKRFILRLTTAMDMRGLTQAKLSKLSGINKNNLSNWSHSKCLPCYKNMLKLSKALDLEVDYFMEQ